jgi:hypothetical protein
MNKRVRPALPRFLCRALAAILLAAAPLGAPPASAQTPPAARGQSGAGGQSAAAGQGAPSTQARPAAQRPAATGGAAGGLSQKQADAVEKGIQTVRALKLKHPVPIAARTPEQATRMLESEIEREYTPEQIDSDGRAGAMLGLYPRGIDLKAANLSLLESQVIAFYDFHTKRMVVVSGALTREFPGQPPEVRAKLAQMILAHEFTHALQDQNFDFGAEDEKLKANGDRSLALHAVAEGDATIAGYAFMLGGINPSLLATLIGNLQSFSQTFTGAAAGVPRGVAQPLIFQYTDGVRFVAQAYQRGGWDAVNRLYRNPPQSTQQILQPRLYYDHPELPDRVAVAGYAPLLRGWHKADEDTLGELGLRIILENTRGMASPDLKLADKWAGDRIVMLRKGKSVGVIWLLALRDAGAAAQFAALYRKVLDRLHRRGTPHRVDTRGAAVLVAVGEPAARFNTLAPVVWKASKITAPGPAVPASAAPLHAAAPPVPPIRMVAAR